MIYLVRVTIRNEAAALYECYLYEPTTKRYCRTWVTDELLHDALNPNEVFEDAFKVLEANWIRYWNERGGLSPKEVSLYN
jgi:hypothetical protein